MDRYCKRLIEVNLPIKRISINARKEKDSRLGHIPRIHIYPAARPVVACRAVMCAALWLDPADDLCPESFRKSSRSIMMKWATKHLNLLSEGSFKRFVSYQNKPEKLDCNIELRHALCDFIAEFANFDNSNIREFLETAQTLTEISNRAQSYSINKRPLVIDPFSGGGAIPLEALRVGADVFASDLNPVSLLIQKVVLEYIPKFGDRLATAIEDWVIWLREREKEVLADLFPNDDDGSVPVAYLWSRTIISESPGVGEYPIEVPMLRTMWLARQKNRKRALRWKRNKQGQVVTKFVEVEYADGTQKKVFQPQLDIFEPKSASEVETGTSSRNAVTCPVTGYTTSASNVEIQLKKRLGGARDARLYCVVIDRPGKSRDFRLAIQADLDAARKAKEKLLVQGAIADIPLEPIPQTMTGVLGATIYGHKTWGSLFTERQLFALLNYSKFAQDYVHSLMNDDPEFKAAVSAALGLIVDRLADLNASLCIWQLNGANSTHVFGRWALPMIVDFAEVNPLAQAGGSPKSAIRRIVHYIKEFSGQFSGEVELQLLDATKHPLPDDSADLLFTDPPYYNAIPYADLLDFFYVWLKRTVTEHHKELFNETLCPKEKELCELASWDSQRYGHKNKEFFEKGMMQAALRSREIIRPGGLGVIVFAHKTTSGWEAILQAIIDAGWVIVASWPIDTEMGSRLRAKGSAVLASSIHLVCRPREDPDGSIRIDDIGDWRDVINEVPKRINNWLPRLAEEGVVGADAIFSCLGPALEIYSRYSSVEKASGEKVTLKEFLEEVWATVSREALKMIFEGADASGFEEDARLTAMWLWTLRTAIDEEGETEGNGDEKVKGLHGYSLEYDAARKIAQGLGVHLEHLTHLVEIKGDTATLLTAGARTRYLFGKDAAYVPKGIKKKLDQQMKLNFEEELKELDEESGGWASDLSGRAGSTVLDQLHQCMILFGAGRGEALRRFLVDDAIGHNPLFWRLAQALSALYPTGTDEKRWVDGVLARKKGLGF